MSKLVQRHLESTTEELEELKRNDYSDSQVRFLHIKRQKLENRVNGPSKCLQDIINFIQFEKMLIKHIRSKRDQRKLMGKKHSLEYSILNRIKSLYEIGIDRFPNDFDFHVSYFKFCIQSNFNGAANIALQSMTKKFSHDPEVWMLAAGRLAHDLHDFNEALKLIYQGLLRHKSSEKLYVEGIKLEVTFFKSKIVALKPEQTQQKQLLEDAVCKKLQQYLGLMFDNIKNFKFYLQVLKLLEDYSFTSPTQEEIVKKLINENYNEEEVWDALAQREKNGFHLESSEATNPSYQLEQCISRYEEGLAKIQRGKRFKLWNMYLDCLIELQKEGITKPAPLQEVFQRASKETRLEEKHFIAWIELAQSNDHALENVLEKATTVWSQSLNLWKLRLEYFITKKNKEKINAIFLQATEALKENSITIWFKWLHQLEDYEESVQVYEKGVLQIKEISDVIKPLYLQYVLVNKGMEEARVLYKKLAQLQPYCKDLHKTMATLESRDLTRNLEEWEKVHILACQQFGEEDINVWINYCQFVVVNFTEYVSKLTKIKIEAESKLPFLLRAAFSEKYQDILSSL